VVLVSEVNSYPDWATSCITLKYTEFLAHYTNYSWANSHSGIL